MNVAIYARQSIDKKDSVSIETQIDICKRICELNQWTYVIYHDKGYSGKNLSRPAFQQMMKDLKSKDIKKVIAYRLDRISRSLFDFLTLINNLNALGVEFLSATENIDTSTPTGRAMNSIILTFAQLERETIAERISDNVTFRALSGQWIGGKVILGFDKVCTVVNGKKVHTLVENEKESKIVKYIFSEYLKSEMSVRKIASALNEQGIKTKNGYTWDANKVSAVLKNILYTKNHIAIYNYFYNTGIKINNSLNEFDNKKGLFIFNRLKGKVEQPIENQTLIVTNHTGFIEASEWIKVQQKLENRKELAPRYGQSNITILSGLVRCGNCGKVMLSSCNTKGRKTPYRCFKCSNKSLSLCNMKCIKCDDIEKIVEDELIKYCNDNKILSKLTSGSSTPDEDLVLNKEKCLAEINELDSKIQKLVYKLIEDDATEQYIRDEIKKLDKIKKEKLNELSEIELKINSQSNEEVAINTALHAVKTFRNFYSQLDFQEKKNILQTLIKAIYITENEVKIDFFTVRGEVMSFALHSICNQHQTTSILINYNQLSEADYNFDVFADVIKFERKKRNMTRNQFAELIGTNYRNIQNWEYENRIPKKHWLGKIEKALNLDLKKFRK